MRDGSGAEHNYAGNRGDGPRRKSKAKAFTLDNTTYAPTAAEYDESKYRNGEQYLIHGMDTVTEKKFRAYPQQDG